MLDANWDLLNGEVAHEIEALNYANQVNVIEALIKLLIAIGGVTETGQSRLLPNVIALKELHRTATLFLLSEPGAFRSVPVHVQGPDGAIIYEPPAPELVESHVNQFFTELDGRWAVNGPEFIAAFCLWKINWIHPFKNGNGRSARAFSYACLCLKYGFPLPGKVTVIDLLMSNPGHRATYNSALRHADAAYSERGEVDVSLLEKLLSDLLVEQLESIAGPNMAKSN